MSVLPIDAVIPDLLQALATHSGVVLQAPPGAGKTTRVPLALLGRPWLAGRRIVVLEPRRLAARAAARRMADQLGEAVGETVGYRIRHDAVVGPKTRIEVVTEGILTRFIQNDPALEGIGAVLFDEFHERSLHADLGLALCLEAQKVFREDLRLLVMSATLDGDPVARLLGDAAIVTSEGRQFPVETRYLDRTPQGRPDETVAGAVVRALEAERGSILVFLPGAREIGQVRRLLAERGVPDGVTVAPLYGDLPQAAQDLAIRPPPPGVRKVVLATTIAETSLTIEGVRVVIDGGWTRVPRFEPNSGMTRLETVRVSKASADQRRGRAGRLEPGICYRMWTQSSHAALLPFTTPEILETDLTPLALELAVWGVSDPAELAWLDPPPIGAFAQARDLLTRLGALDRDGRVTGHGREMATLGLHPRLAHMVLIGRRLGLGRLAADLAALLGERDILRGGGASRDADITTRLEILHAAGDRSPGATTIDRAALHRIRESARQLRRRLDLPPDRGPRDAVGPLVALAYPDRIAQRRPGGADQYRLSNGRAAFLAEPQPLSTAAYLAVADLDGVRRQSRIFLAAPIAQSDLESHFADHLERVETVEWDPRDEAVAARIQLRLGELVLKDEALTGADPARIADALICGIRTLGLGVLPWTDGTVSWRARVAFLRSLDPDGGWPDLSDDHLTETLEDWLAPYLSGLSRRAHLARLDLGEILEGMLDWHRRTALDRLAPTHLTVPSGSRVRLDYGRGEPPVLAVRLQEMFGLTETPRVADGRVPVTLHLLSPAHRPVQVTRDLASFWAGAYREVCRDLRGRYPKHHWPDDPLVAEPTRRTKRPGR